MQADDSLKRKLQDWFSNARFPHDTELIDICCETTEEKTKIAKTSPSACFETEGWCEINQFRQTSKADSLTAEEQLSMLSAIEQTPGLEVSSDRTKFRRTMKLQKQLIDQIRQELKSSLRDDAWPTSRELHDLKGELGWIRLEDIAGCSRFAKISSNRRLCRNLLLLARKDARRKLSGNIEIHQDGQRVRRKYIHDLAKREIRSALEKCAQEHELTQWADFHKTLELPRMIQSKQSFSYEIGKYDWPHLVFMCSRYSRVVEFNASGELRIRSTKVGFDFNEIDVRQPILAASGEDNGDEYMRAVKDFRVTSYNILADSLIDKLLFPWVSDKAMGWTRRRWCIMDTIWRHGGSLVCLQEVQRDHRDFFRNQFHNLGYKSTYFHKQFLQESSWTNQQLIGNLIAWDHKRWKLVSETKIKLKDLEQHCRASEKQQKRYAQPQVAILLRLQRRKDDNILNLCTTHISAQWNHHDIQLVQTQFLLEEVQKHVPKDEPLILCGDFNVTSDAPSYQLLTQGVLSQNRLKDVRASDPEIPLPYHSFHHELNLQSAYATSLGAEPELTNFVERSEQNDSPFCGPLDYIFFNQHLDIQGVRKLPPKHLVKSEFALPNILFPSDHLPVQAIFSFTNPKDDFDMSH